MIRFKSLDDKEYSVPEEFVKGYGGYFELFSEGDIPMNSSQINYIFFGSDPFKSKPDDFIQSIDIFLQFSNKNLDEKVIDKIQSMIEGEEKYEKFDLSLPNDREYLLRLVSGYLSINTTFEDLKQYLLSKFRTHWRIGKAYIKNHIRSLKDNVKVKEYIMTLTDLNDFILHYIEGFEKYCFQDDVFGIYFLEHFTTIKKDIIYDNVLDHIFRYGSAFIFRYVFENVSFIDQEKILNQYVNSSSKMYPIHYACMRNFEDMIVYLIERGSDVDKQGYKEDTPLQMICKYSTPRMLKYILQQPLCTYSYYDNYHALSCNVNPEMVAFKKEINYHHHKSFKYVIEKLGL